ncbi:MAG TPA: DinB family protein [Chryseolinea sp.]|nr:DinB family protein [Chryseolinea sp.]
MNHKLKVLYEQLEGDRNRLMAELSKTSSDRLFLKPSKDKWSVNEILIHLVTSEQLTLRYLKKKSLGVDHIKNSGVGEKIRYAVLQVSQRLPLKFKAPESVVSNTPEALPFPELHARWNETRHDLEQFLDSITDENVNKLIYKHPVAGRFDIRQCLMFMREHYQHHLPQIKRLL